MKAMILAAGLGTRLQPLTNVVSKPMVQMVGRPCMEHAVRLLRKHGFDDIVVNLHHMPEKIKGYFGDGSKFGVKITYSYEEELLGTAGGLKKVESFFGGEPVLIVSGDGLTDINLTEFFRHHKEQGGIATLALKEVTEPSLYGVVVQEGERIRAFQEKPAKEEAISNLANTGIYLFEPEIFVHIPAQSFYDFGRQVFPELMDKGEKMAGYKMSGYWCDVGDLAVYREAHYDMLTGQVQVDLPGKDIGSNIWLGKPVSVHKDAVLAGPVFLGDGCKLEKGAEIHGPAVLGKGCRVAEGAVLKRSILWDNVKVGTGAVVDDCIIAGDCDIPAGMKLEGEVLEEEMLAAYKEIAAGERRKPRGRG